MESSNCHIRHLHPRNNEVRLHDGSQVTIPVFDTKAMILDLVTNPDLMNDNNIAEGYNQFTGDIDPNNISNQKYGEIHTGDEWLLACDRFCVHPDDNTRTCLWA